MPEPIRFLLDITHPSRTRESCKVERGREESPLCLASSEGRCSRETALTEENGDVGGWIGPQRFFCYFANEKTEAQVNGGGCKVMHRLMKMPLSLTTQSDSEPGPLLSQGAFAGGGSMGLRWEAGQKSHGREALS